jgi:hypothetical protein
MLGKLWRAGWRAFVAQRCVVRRAAGSGRAAGWASWERGVRWRCRPSFSLHLQLDVHLFFAFGLSGAGFGGGCCCHCHCHCHFQLSRAHSVKRVGLGAAHDAALHAPLPSLASGAFPIASPAGVAATRRSHAAAIADSAGCFPQWWCFIVVDIRSPFERVHHLVCCCDVTRCGKKPSGTRIPLACTCRRRWFSSRPYSPQVVRPTWPSQQASFGMAGRE